MKMEITKTKNGFNGKTYSEMNLSEKLFFDEFLMRCDGKRSVSNLTTNRKSHEL
jgi:hypothetical protein